MVSLYKSIVRPTLKTVPQYVNKLLLERIQHRFTRLFPELKNLQYEERLRELGLWSLEERCNRVDLIEIFKMIKGLSHVPWSQFFSRAETSVTRCHNWKLNKSGCSLDTSLHFFSKRAINRWNSLTQEADAPSLNSRTAYRNAELVRWTFSWAKPSYSPMAAQYCQEGRLMYVIQVQPHLISTRDGAVYISKCARFHIIIDKFPRSHQSSMKCWESTECISAPLWLWCHEVMPLFNQRLLEMNDIIIKRVW